MVQARKRFGQNFLVDEDVIRRIAQALHLRAQDHLLEIGPGRGALTAELAGQTEAFTAVEIDRDLIPLLRARFPQVNIVNADILSVDLETVLHAGGSRLVGNLPYNISTPLLLKIVEAIREHPKRIRDGHFMLQREMAERLSAVPGNKAWGRLSVMLQITCDIQHLFDVAPESFDPAPKVWSSIVRLVPKEEPLLDEPGHIQALDRVLRLAFSGRRKRLANSLKALALDWSTLGIDPDIRADHVTLQEFVCLAQTTQAIEKDQD